MLLATLLNAARASLNVCCRQLNFIRWIMALCVQSPWLLDEVLLRCPNSRITSVMLPRDRKICLWKSSLYKFVIYIKSPLQKWTSLCLKTTNKPLSLWVNYRNALLWCLISDTVNYTLMKWVKFTCARFETIGVSVKLDGIQLDGVAQAFSKTLL